MLILLHWSSDLEFLTVKSNATSKFGKSCLITAQPVPAPNLVTPTENPDELLHRRSMTSKTLYQTVRPSRESLPEEAGRTSLCTQELEHVDCGEVEDNEDKPIDNETLENYVPREEPSSGPIGDYISRSEKEKLREHSIRASVKVSMRHVVSQLIEKQLTTYSQ